MILEVARATACPLMLLGCWLLSGRDAILDIPAGTKASLVLGAAPVEVNLAGTLVLDTRQGDTAAVTRVRALAPTATIEIQGPAKTISLGGPLEISFRGTATVTGNAACRLVLPVVSVREGNGDGILIANGPGVDVGALTGVVKLRGSALGCTVRTLDISRLEKDGTGSWTVTGDNSARTWGVAIGSGRMALAPGARFGNNAVSVGDGAVLALPAGGQLPSRLTLGNGATLDLADGGVGDTYIPFLQGPVNGTFTLRLDISATGVDHLRVGDSAGTSGGRVIFNPVGPTLTPGTYAFISCSSPKACLLEQHYGFDYIGNFENHYNIVYTSRLGPYDLTMRPIFVGTWPAMTVTVTPGAGGAKRVPLALPLPGERGHEVKTPVDAPTPIALAGQAYDGTIVSYAYEQPGHGTVTGTGASVTYMPATKYRGTDHFTFTVTDSQGATSAAATIYIGVGSDVHLPPMAFPQLGVTTARNAARPITLSGVEYGVNANGTIASYAYTQPAHGTVTGTGPDVTYTPAAGFSGSDGFTFTVTDNEGAPSEAARIIVTVAPEPGRSK